VVVLYAWTHMCTTLEQPPQHITSPLKPQFVNLRNDIKIRIRMASDQTARIKATSLDLAADARSAPSERRIMASASPSSLKNIFGTKRCMVKYFGGGRLLDFHEGVVHRYLELH